MLYTFSVIFSDANCELIRTDKNTLLFMVKGSCKYQGLEACPPSSLKAVIKAWKKFRADSPDIFTCYASTEDGYGEHRRRIYKRYGLYECPHLPGLMCSFPDRYTEAEKEAEYARHVGLVSSETEEVSPRSQVFLELKNYIAHAPRMFGYVVLIVCIIWNLFPESKPKYLQINHTTECHSSAECK